MGYYKFADAKIRAKELARKNNSDYYIVREKDGAGIVEYNIHKGFWMEEDGWSDTEAIVWATTPD